MNYFATDALAIGFWGYRRFGEQNTAETVAMWKDAGFNVAISFIYENDSREEDMLELLDLCAENGLKVILYDDRIHCHRLREMSEKKYEEAVRRSVRQFGAHPAACAFFVSDEPNKDTLPYTRKAVEIVQAFSPIPAFVNFYPMWRSKDYVELMGAEGKDIADIYAPAVRQSGLRCLAYDCYSQMDARDENGLDGYFDNLNTYYAIAKDCDVPLWTSLLITPHYAFRRPTIEDLRWQMSTAIAHGVKGIQWFMLYDNADGLGDSPIDIDNEKQPSYYDMRKVNREYARKIGRLIPKLTLEEVQHYAVTFGGTRLYAEGCDVYLKSFQCKYRDGAIISRFTHTETGHTYYMFVNNSRTAGNKLKYAFAEPYAHLGGQKWLGAGEFCLIELTEKDK